MIRTRFETTEGRDWGVIKLGCQVEGGICKVLAIANYVSDTHMCKT